MWIDAPSITEARHNVQGSGVEDRVTFEMRDVADPSLAGTYDLVVMFEVLHDLPRPVEVLRNIRRALAPGGSAIIMDERVPERFTVPTDEIERFMYSCSVLHCLPIAMVEQPSAATGTVLRPGTVQRHARQAGFSTFEVLPIQEDFFRFYRLTP